MQAIERYLISRGYCTPTNQSSAKEDKTASMMLMGEDDDSEDEIEVEDANDDEDEDDEEEEDIDYDDDDDDIDSQPRGYLIVSVILLIT